MFSNKIDNSWRVTRRLAYIMLLVVALPACVGSDMSELESFIATAHQGRKPEIEPLPEIPPFKAFAYDNDNEVDPFSTLNIVRRGESEGFAGDAARRPDADRRRQPLEKFPLDALQMVGTITKKGVSHVVVKTNEGTALLAAVGEYMGLNDGKIKAILPDEQRVQLVETVLDPAGRWVTRDVEITITE